LPLIAASTQLQLKQQLPLKAAEHESYVLKVQNHTYILLQQLFGLYSPQVQ